MNFTPVPWATPVSVSCHGLSFSFSHDWWVMRVCTYLNKLSSKSLAGLTPAGLTIRISGNLPMKKSNDSQNNVSLQLTDLSSGREARNTFKMCCRALLSNFFPPENLFTAQGARCSVFLQCARTWVFPSLSDGRPRHAHDSFPAFTDQPISMKVLHTYNSYN